MSKTMILAIGGAGCNMAETVMRDASVHWVREATFLFADSDQAILEELAKKGYTTIDLKDSGIPKEKFKGAEKVYFLVGLGGKTGTTHIIDVINSVRTAGVEDVSAIVTTPFYFEGENKSTKAKEALGKLNGVKIKVLHNDELLERYPDINFATSFYYADMSALKAIESGEI